jgi:hypothetical protein
VCCHGIAQSGALRNWLTLNNLIVSYDLNRASQDYPRVISAIRALGMAAELQQSVWFVASLVTAADAAQRVWAAMDPTGALLVVDATNNEALIKPTDSEAAADLADGWTPSWRSRVS